MVTIRDLPTSLRRQEGHDHLQTKSLFIPNLQEGSRETLRLGVLISAAPSSGNAFPSLLSTPHPHPRSLPAFITV